MTSILIRSPKAAYSAKYACEAVTYAQEYAKCEWRSYKEFFPSYGFSEVLNDYL